jgi:hypothetical protein
MASKIDDMLPGAAAGLNNVTGFPCEVSLQDASDCLVIAVVCRRVETAVGLDRPAVLAEFDDILSHSTYLPASSTLISLEL